MRRSFLFLEKTVHSHSRWVFGFVILVTLLALTQTVKVRGVISVYDLLPSSFPSLGELKKTDRDFNDSRDLILNVLPQAPLTEKNLCEIRHWISHEVLNNTMLTKAFSVFDLRRAREVDNKLFYVRQLELHCEEATDKAISWDLFKGSFWDGLLVDSVKHSFLVQFSFSDAAIDPKMHAFSYSVLKDFSDRWNKELGSRLGLKTQFLSTAAYESYLAKGTIDFKRVHILLIIVLLIFFRLFMGTWKAGILYLLSLLIAVIWVVGMIGFLGGTFDILTNALLVMIAISTLQDLAFVAMDKMYRVNPSRNSFRRLQFAGFWTSFTTIAGFGSLAVSSLPMIRDFGIWAASGAFFEWLLTFFFLPLLTRKGQFFEHWVNYDKAIGFRLVEKMNVFASSRWLRFHFIALLVVLLPWGLHFYDEPKLMFPKSHVFRDDTDSFIHQMGWEYSASVVVTDSDLDQEALKVALAKNEFVKKVDSAQDAFATAAEGLSEGGKALASREFFKMWQLDRYFGKGDAQRFHIFLKTSEISDILRLRDEIHQMCDEKCYVSGPIVTYAEFVRHLSQTLFESLFVSLILVGCILLFLAHALDFQRPMLVLYCALWGPAILLILIMVFRIPINMMTSLTASVVLGLTGDNIIEFMFAKKTTRFEVGMDARFPGAIVTSVMMSMACLVFLAAPFDPPRTLGILFCLGFLLSLFGDYFVLRYLWNKKVLRK